MTLGERPASQIRMNCDTTKGADFQEEMHDAYGSPLHNRHTYYPVGLFRPCDDERC